MLIPRIVRTGPEKIFSSCKNGEASATMSDGEFVEFDTATTAAHGSQVIKTVGLSLKPAGFVSGKDIPPGDFGLVQCYGFHPNAKTTAAALAAGTILTSDAAAAVVAGAIGDDPAARIGVCLKLGVANRAGVFVRLV